MQKIEITIKGVAPLLQHRFPEATAQELVNPVKITKATKPTPEQDAEASAYRLKTGELCQPAEHILQSCIKAAVDFKIGGRGKLTYKNTVGSCLIITPEYIPHASNDYEIFSVPVVIQRARIVRSRPLIREWELSFQAQIIDTDSLGVDILEAILKHAGERIGIGDWRPRYGRYEVTKFQPIK